MLSPAHKRIRRHEARLNAEGCALEEREEEKKRREETSATHPRDELEARIDQCNN